MELLLLGLLPLLAFGIFGSNDDEADADEGGNDDTGSAPSDPDNQILRGDDEANVLLGGNATDLLLAGGGADDLSGGEGEDILVGEAGPDVLRGNAGEDVLLGGAGVDELFGGPQDDILIGGAGDDNLQGGQGYDILIGSSGADTLLGNEGNDVLIGLEPREGLDMADIVQIAGLDPSDLEDELPVVFGAELTGNDVARVFAGVESGDPSDGLLLPENDNDFIEGGRGNDQIAGDRGDIITGGEGTDVFGVLYQDGADVTSILDFDPANEALAIFVDGPATGALSFVDDAFDDGVNILLDGEVVAYLEGVLADQIRPGSVTLRALR